MPQTCIEQIIHNHIRICYGACPFMNILPTISRLAGRLASIKAWDLNANTLTTRG